MAMQSFCSHSRMAITNDLTSVLCWVSQMASSHISSSITSFSYPRTKKQSRAWPAPTIHQYYSLVSSLELSAVECQAGSNCIRQFSERGTNLLGQRGQYAGDLC